MKLEFGKKVLCGNYEILKYVKSLGKKDVKRLRAMSGIPEDAAKHLSRGGLPFIRVSTCSGSWGVEFVIGTSMYDAINGIHVVVDEDGVRQMYGVEKHNAEAMFVGMLADTTVVGDLEYMREKQRILKEYLDRESVRRNADADSSPTAAAESDAAVQEVIDRDEAAAGLIKKCEDIVSLKEEKG